MIKKIIHQSKRALLLAAVYGWGLSMTAQSGTQGNTFVHTGTEAAVHSVSHSFSTGGGTPLDGIVGTERVSPQGYVSFVGTASHTTASDAAHVDGYAKTYMSSAFTFPIGDNGKYRPARVSIASVANPANAAYFRANPTSAITSSLKGGNEPVLPSSTYPSVTKAADVQNVSTIEYWDINGTQSAQISLTWDATSGVAAMTGGALAKLTIVGWDGTKWVSIPSTVDATSILGGASTTSTGSITTNANITPNSYDVYTLAVICPTTSAPTVATATPNPLCLGSTTVLTATAHVSDTLRWYSDAALTTVVGIGSPVNASITLTPPVGSTIYYAAYTNGICKSIPASPISVVVNPIPNISSIDSVNPSTCTNNNGSITLKGLLANTTYSYSYTNASGSGVTASGATNASGHLVLSSLVGGSYTNIQVSRIGCTSNTIAKVQLTPSAPTAGTPNTTPICLGKSSILSATGSGGTITWYSDAALTVNLATGSSYTVTPAITTTYYIAVVNGTCKSAKDSTTVTVTSCLNDSTKGTNMNTPVNMGPAIVVAPSASQTVTASHGTATVNPDGTLNYTPPANKVGTDTVTRVICVPGSPSAICDTQKVAINIAPNYADSIKSTPQGTPVSAGTPVVALPGTSATVTTTGPTNGTATVNPNGTVTYTPATGFVGKDTVKRIVCVTFTDATTKCDTSLMVFVVTPSIPDANDSTALNTPKVVGTPVTTTAGTSISTTATTPHGTVTVLPDGRISYVPNTGFVGIDSIKRIVCLYDSATTITKCDTSFIIMNVYPSIADSTKTTAVNTPVNLGPAVTPSPNVTQTLTASNGTTSLNPDGTVKYTPNPNYVGTDTIRRIVCTTNPAYCDTSITVINIAPNYRDTSASTSQGTPVTSGTPVLTMPGSTSTVTTTGPTNGTATVNPNGTVTYTPATGFVGVDTVKRVVCVTFADGTTKCDTSLIIFNVSSPITNTTVATNMNTPLIGIGTPVSGPNVTTSASAKNGTATVNPDGTITYVPKPNTVGTDTIKRVICVTTGTTTKCDTSLIIVNVAPTYPDTTATTSTGVAVTAGTPVVVTSGSVANTTATASNGTVTVNPNGTVSYTPRVGFVGMDTIKRIVCITFTNGISKCDTSLIIVRVTAPDGTNPIGTGSSTGVTTGIGTPISVGPAVVGGSGTTVNQTASANNGSVTVNPDGSLSYNPNAGFVGTDTITRVVCVTYIDGKTICDTSYITVMVGSKELVNYISPNGDGVNDKWILPAYLFAKYPNLKVMIYNRWGNIVWRSEGTYQNNWGGEHYDGTKLPDGVYYYILELSKEFNESKTGFIEVMRQ